MAEPKQAPIDCLRCGRPLYFLGVRNFHEGTRIGFLGDLFEAFQHREELEMFACGECGHVEFFVGGVGEEARGWEEKLPPRRSRDPFDADADGQTSSS